MINELHACVGAVLREELHAGGSLVILPETVQPECKLATSNAIMFKHCADFESQKASSLVRGVGRRRGAWVWERVGKHIDDVDGLSRTRRVTNDGRWVSIVTRTGTAPAAAFLAARGGPAEDGNGSEWSLGSCKAT